MAFNVLLIALIIISTQKIVSCLKVQAQIPSNATEEDSLWLNCTHDHLDETRINSISWYKDGVSFYRFRPNGHLNNEEVKSIFWANGFKVHVSRSINELIIKILN